MNPELKERPLEAVMHRFEKSQLDHYKEIVELRTTFEKATIKLVGTGFVAGVLLSGLVWGLIVW